MPALELRSILERLKDPNHEPPAPPAGTGLTAKTLWSAAESGGHLNIEVYAVGRSGDIAARYHKGFPAMFICWEGAGTITVAERDSAASTWKPPYKDLSFKKYDSVYVPPDASYAIKADLAEGDDRLVLLAVYPLQPGGFNVSPGSLQGTANGDYKHIRHLDPYRTVPPTETPMYKWDDNLDHRATRNRIWGKDGQGADGEPEPAKEYFHLVAYCFNPTQENPAHFHPRSVEFMLGLTGSAETWTRHKRPEADGWDDTKFKQTITPGFTALIGLADVHRYINTTDEKAIVLALQTPQPIMHTLEHEVRLFAELEDGQ